MISNRILDDALAAHADWKNRFQAAIESGHSDLQPSVVRSDMSCRFGLWLRDLSGEEKRTPEYEAVRELHVYFHQLAAEILQLAIDGKRDQAVEMLGFGGAYGVASGKLVLALHTWKRRIEEHARVSIP